MKSFSPGALLLCASFGIFAGLGSYTFIYAKGFSYLSHSPEACVNCHVMREQYDGWQKSSHHAAAVCVDCHMPESPLGKLWVKAEDGFLHSLKFTLQNYPDHIQIRESNRQIVNNACLKCHSGMAGHIADPGAQDSRFCSRCHANVGH